MLSILKIMKDNIPERLIIYQNPEYTLYYGLADEDEQTENSFIITIYNPYESGTQGIMTKVDISKYANQVVEQYSKSYKNLPLEISYNSKLLLEVFEKAVGSFLKDFSYVFFQILILDSQTFNYRWNFDILRFDMLESGLKLKLKNMEEYYEYFIPKGVSKPSEYFFKLLDKDFELYKELNKGLLLSSPFACMVSIDFLKEELTYYYGKNKQKIVNISGYLEYVKSVYTEFSYSAFLSVVTNAVRNYPPSSKEELESHYFPSEFIRQNKGSVEH